jgi:hypothetical protein
MSQMPVLKNTFSEGINPRRHRLNIVNEEDFIAQYNRSKKIYTVSEYALDWIISILKDEQLNKQITLLKNKAAFRETCRGLYPDFFFKELSYTDLLSFDISEVQLPVVLKPSIGFLSIGVYVIHHKMEWTNALIKIQMEFEKQMEKFPDTVVKGDTFLLESYIKGKEFAIDLYFKNKEPVIINIFEHPFSSEKDVSDRLYVTSKKLFDNYLELFPEYISGLNKILKLDNIPVHLELRVDENNNIVPIEMNPLRFAGMCLNELNFYITGKHPLIFYFSNIVPDYKNMWTGYENEFFYFSIIEKPIDSNRTKTNKIRSAYPNILELRMLENSSLDIEAFVFSKTNSETELENILASSV